MNNFEADYNALDNIIKRYSNGEMTGDEALNAGHEITGNYMDEKPKRSFIEFLTSTGNKDVAANYINTVKNFDSVRASNWANVDIHNPDNMNMFYDRYRAFGDDTFNKLGFSPFRNNDAYYNEHTSTWDNHKRVLKTIPGMMWNMMKQTWFIGDENELARDYAKRNAIAYDTREDGSFYNNMLLSSSATLGIMASLLVEKAVGIGITALTGGAAAPAVATAEAAQGARDVSTFSRLFQKMGELNRLVKSTEKVKNATTVGSKFAEIGKGLNPLKNVTDFISDVNAGELTGLSRLEKIRRGSFAAWADARTANLVYKESALEANLARDEFVDSMIRDFQDKHGRMPDGVEIDDIRSRANSVKNSVVMGNLAAIYLTDKIMFNDLLDPVLDETLRSSTSGMPSGLMYDGKKFFTTSWKDWIPGRHFKAKLKNSTGSFIDWSLGSVSEGLQENIQDVLADAAKSYYSDYYNTNYGKNSMGEFLAFMFSNDYMPEAIRNQISEQGLETFLTGALMGGPITLGTKTLAKAYDLGMRSYDMSQVNKLKTKMEKLEKDKGVESQEYKDAKQNYDTALSRYNRQYKHEEAKKAADIFNNMMGSPEQFINLMDKMEHSAILNRISSSINKELGLKSAKDSEVDIESSLEYGFSLAMRTGQLDKIIAHYDELIENAGEEYSKHGAENAEEFKSDLKRARDKAESMKNIWNLLDKKLQSQFHPERYKVGSDKWFDEMMGKKAEMFVKQAAVFLNEDMRRMTEYELESLNDINDVLSKMSVEDKAIFSTDVGVILRRPDIEREIKSLESQIKDFESIGGGITAENKKRYEDIKRKHKGLSDMLEALDLESKATEAQSKYDEGVSKYNELVESKKNASKRLQDAISKKDNDAVKAIKKEIKDINEKIKELRGINYKLKRNYESIVGNVSAHKYKKGRTHKQLQKEKLEASVKSYLEYIAQKYNVDKSMLTSDDESSLYNRILKIYKNKSDMDVVRAAMYSMFDPNAYNYAVNQVAEDRKNIIRNLFNIMVEAARTYDKNNSTNQLLNDLYDAGFWVDPKALEEFESGKTVEMPDVYYLNQLIKDGGISDEDLFKGVPIVRDSADFNRAVKIFQAYCHKNNITLTGINISERRVKAKDLDAKHKNDNRSYYQLCEFYGIDPTKEEQTVDAEDVINKIISDDNIYANETQKTFAQNLKRLIKNNGRPMYITFRFGQSRPVEVDGDNIIVDLRYAGEDFNIGVMSQEDNSNRMFSGDYIILKGLFTKMMRDSLQSDSTFRDNISRMLTKSKEYVDLHGTYETELPEGMSAVDLYSGFENEEAFVVEAMLNPRFQQLLSTIQLDDETPGYNYGESRKSVWENFIKAIVDFIRRYGGSIGVNNNNMLNTTIDMVTSKLEGISWSPYVIQPEILPTKNKNTESTPVRDDDSESNLKSLDTVDDDTSNNVEYKKRMDVFLSNDGIKNELLSRFKALYGDEYDCSNDDAIINSALFASHIMDDDDDMSKLISQVNQPVQLPRKGDLYVDENGNEYIITDVTTGKSGNTIVKYKKNTSGLSFGNVPKPMDVNEFMSKFTRKPNDSNPPVEPTIIPKEDKSINDLDDDEKDDIKNKCLSEFDSSSQSISTPDDVVELLATTFENEGYKSIADDIRNGDIDVDDDLINSIITDMIDRDRVHGDTVMVYDKDSNKYYKHNNGNILVNGKWIKLTDHINGEYDEIDQTEVALYGLLDKNIYEVLKQQEVNDSIKLSIKFFFSGEFNTDTLDNFVTENSNLSEQELLDQLIKDRCK